MQIQAAACNRLDLEHVALVLAIPAWPRSAGHAARLSVAAQLPVCGLAWLTTATPYFLQDSPQPSTSHKPVEGSALHPAAVTRNRSSHLGHHLGRRRPQQVGDQLQLVHYVPAREQRPPQQDLRKDAANAPDVDGRAVLCEEASAQLWRPVPAGGGQPQAWQGGRSAQAGSSSVHPRAMACSQSGTSTEAKGLLAGQQEGPHTGAECGGQVNATQQLTIWWPHSLSRRWLLAYH